jgi:hypothetical protein
VQIIVKKRKKKKTRRERDKHEEAWNKVHVMWCDVILKVTNMACICTLVFQIFNWPIKSLIPFPFYILWDGQSICQNFLSNVEGHINASNPILFKKQKKHNPINWVII